MAFITYLEPFNGHLAAVVSADKAKDIIRALNDPSGLSEAQKAYIGNIKDVHLAKETASDWKPEVDTGYSGIQQGMSEAVPRGDR